MLHLQVRDWLQQATGIELDDTVDMFCARYDHTDYLSCHDDELEGRRIAYIFYLVGTLFSGVRPKRNFCFEVNGRFGPT